MALAENHISERERQYWRQISDDHRKIERELMDTLPGRETLSRQNVERVIEWKMVGQGGRATRYQDSLQAVSDDTIEHVTRAAIAADHLRTQIDVLRGLPGVGLGVATAILGFVSPDTRAVVDYTVYNGVYDTDKRTLSPAQAVELINHLSTTYDDTPFTLREVDRALFVTYGGLDD